MKKSLLNDRYLHIQLSQEYSVKNLILVLGLVFSLNSFASLENGTYQCDGSDGVLTIYQQQANFFSAYIIYPQDSGRMSQLDSIELFGKDSNEGVMFNDEFRRLGTVNVSEDGKSIQLNFNSSVLICTK